MHANADDRMAPVYVQGMKFTAMVLVMATGCSLGLKHLDSDYDKRTIPRCDTDDDAPLGDAVGAVAFAVGAGAVAIFGHDAEDGSSKWIPVVVGGIAAVALGISASTGFGWTSECSAANKQWDARQIEQDEHVRDVKAREAREAHQEALRYDRAAERETSHPRGFYCSDSATVATAGFCTREKADCERTRGVAESAVPDLSSCQLVESAFCFTATPDDARCAPTLAACESQQARVAAVNAPTPVPACAETK